MRSIFANVEKRLSGGEKMKKIKCGNCKREIEVADDVIMVLCGCGYVTEVNSKER